MSKLELQRDHKGALHAMVNGSPIAGAIVQSITTFNDVGPGVTIIVPMRDLTISEQANVIPMRAVR